MKSSIGRQPVLVAALLVSLAMLGVMACGGEDEAPLVAAPLAATAPAPEPAAPAPATNGLAPMQQARGSHTATLLRDGRVLVAGGKDESGPLATAVVYDPSTRDWLPAGNMNELRYRHAATALSDGRVLVTGGAGVDETHSSAEIYDTSAGHLGYY